MNAVEERQKNVGKAEALNALYLIATERCSFLMEDDKYREIILAADNREEVLVKGYFQGYYEALKVVDSR